MIAIKGMQQATGFTISTLRASMTEEIKSCSQLRVYSTGAINLKNEIVQHILQKRFDLSRW